MTQNTQTTAERIRALLIPHPFDDFQLRRTIKTIAAEIDSLTAQLAEAREQHKHCDLFLDSANADLRECQSALRLALAGTEQKYFAIPARIDDVRAALADAQAQLAEARAEVERLRPAADAWKAREAQRIAFETFDRDPTPGSHDALTGANMAMLGTGLRARAAKEAKP